MNILVVGEMVSPLKIAKKLSEDNKELNVDYFGTVKNYTNTQLDNLKFIDTNYITDENYIDEVCKFLLLNGKKYDIVYAHNYTLQRSKKLQNIIQTYCNKSIIPSYNSSNLEYSKLLTKSLFTRLDIPTPSFEIINDNLENYINNKLKYNQCCVVKVDSVIVGTGHSTWIANFDNYSSWSKKIKQIYPNNLIYYEEYVDGYEISYHILTNGDSWIYLGSSADYKKLYENNLGINCTSAGSCGPINLSIDIETKISQNIDKLLNYLNDTGEPYIGIMYIGIIIKNDIPYFLEINTRPGEPEFSTIVDNINSNLLDNLYRLVFKHNLTNIQFDKNKSIAIQLLHKNYTYKNPPSVVKPNLKIDNDLDIYIFEKLNLNNNLYSCIINKSKDYLECREKIYNYLENKDLGSYRYRHDIGINLNL